MPSPYLLRPRHRATKTCVFASLLVIVLAALLAGCGGSEPKTYSNAEHGFSFQYPGDWQVLELEPGDLPQGVATSVGAWDPRGSGNEAELAFDFVSVDVLEFSADSGVSADTLQEDFQRWLADSGSADSTFAVAEDPAPATVGGVDGYQATYTYNDGGTDVRCTEYWLLAGNVMYDLYTSASEAHWQGSQAAFETFLDSFTVGGQD